jgi:hypothetical protein
MSHRRPDPTQAILEQRLRRALRLAADSIEPAGDGLDRIRTKIAAGPSPSVQLTGWAAWRSRYLTSILAMLTAVAAFLEPIAMRMWYAFCAVVDRVWYAFADFMEQFRPEDGGTGWARWLRPAAALTAAFLVVVGLSFAVTAVPSALIKVSGNHNPVGGGGSGNGAGGSGHSGSLDGNGGQIGQGGSSAPTSSPSCQPGSGGHSPTATPSTSATPSPTTTPTPTTSPTPSPSPSSGDSGSPTPSVTPTPTGSASAQATQSPSSPPGLPGSQPGSAAADGVPGPAVSSPRPGQAANPSASGSKSPCRAA